MQFKSVLRYEPPVHKFRLFRVMWGNDQRAVKLSLALIPKLLGFEREFNSLRITVLGIHFHKEISYGGRFV